MKRSRKQHIRNKRGYTLIELMVCVSIAAACGFGAVIYYPDLMQSYHRLDARTLLIHDIRRAQAEAITAGCRGILTVASDNKSYSYGCDFLSYDTTIPPAPDSTLFVRSLPANIIMTNTGTVIFDSRGRAVDTSGIMNTVNVHLIDVSGSSSNHFATGTLFGTGAFTFSES